MFMGVYGGVNDAEIIFASPKINRSIMNELQPCINDINIIFRKCGLKFKARIIANDEFYTSVLQPILIVSEGVADTSELFLRSYQMYTMFVDTSIQKEDGKTANILLPKPQQSKTINIPLKVMDESVYKELKIGKLAQTVFRKLLEDGKASEEEVKYMQQANYSKQFFDLQYPVLVRADSDYDTVRYYVNPLTIRGEKYMMCSQWFETAANNDRPYLLNWIAKHQD